MDNTALLADNLRWAPAGVVNLANNLIKLKSDKDPWIVFEAIVDAWQKTNPKRYDSFIHQLEDTKKNSKTTFIGGKEHTGVSVDKSGTGGTLLHKIDMPVKVVYMIKKLYPDMNLDKEFYDKWAEKFPKMVVSEVI